MRAFILIPMLFIYTVCEAQSEKYMDTIIINQHKFIRTFTGEKMNNLVSFSGDTVLKNGEYYSVVKFIDINADGYADIRAFVYNNTPNECENYLYDKKYNKFRLIKNSDLDIKLIKGTKYYYSYNRAGCADLNWESYLSKIENYNLVSVGYIKGQGCDFDIKQYPQVIEVFKILNAGTGKEVLIEKLPYLKYIPKFEDKWDFIRKYWRKNLQKFAD